MRTHARVAVSCKIDRPRRGMKMEATKMMERLKDSPNPDRVSLAAIHASLGDKGQSILLVGKSCRTKGS
jgi:hypothetical protein